jgi:hypothetical protein
MDHRTDEQMHDDIDAAMEELQSLAVKRGMIGAVFSIAILYECGCVSLQDSVRHAQGKAAKATVN